MRLTPVPLAFGVVIDAVGIGVLVYLYAVFGPAREERPATVAGGLQAAE